MLIKVYLEIMLKDIQILFARNLASQNFRRNVKFENANISAIVDLIFYVNKSKIIKSRL